MSKLSADTVREAVENILAFSAKKKRNFHETVELQVALKNYDPQKDKRFSGVIRVPFNPRRNYNVCVLGNAKDCERSQAAGVACMSVEDLKEQEKNKKLISDNHRSLAA